MAFIKTPRTTIVVIDPADVVEPEEPAYGPPPESDPSNITLNSDSFNISSQQFIELPNIAVAIDPVEESE